MNQADDRLKELKELEEFFEKIGMNGIAIRKDGSVVTADETLLDYYKKTIEKEK